MAPTNAPATVDSKKRKRPAEQTTNTTNTKKPRPNDHAPTTPESNTQISPSTEPGDSGSQDLCPAREILDEKKRYYLIAWEDDPVSGEKYRPTWEPKANANEELVAEWADKKKARQAEKKAKRAASKSKTKKASLPPRRTRRIIDSSPTTNPTPTSPPQSPQTPQNNHLAAEEQSPDTTPSHEAVQSDEPTQAPAVQPTTSRTAQAVEISRPTNFDPAEFERYLTQQTALSSSSPAGESHIAGSSVGNGSVADPTTPQSIAVSTPTKFGEDRVIPDSQGPSESYIVSTQAPSEPEHPLQSPGKPDQGTQQVLSSGLVVNSPSPAVVKKPENGFSGPFIDGAESAEQSGIEHGSKKPASSPVKDGISRQDFAGSSQAETINTIGSLSVPQSRQTESPVSPIQASDDTFQPAQIIPASSRRSSTQDDSGGSVRPTTEVVQGTPFKETTADSISSSSLGSRTSSAAAPRRPQNPLPRPAINPDTVLRRSSAFDKVFEARVKKNKMEKEAAKRRAQLEKTNSPTFSADGTRSPSTIPDRALPQPSQQTPLRAMALTNSAVTEMSPPTRPIAATPALIIPGISGGQIDGRSIGEPHLEKGEYIVPLSLTKVDAIQMPMYRDFLDKSHDLVRDFIEASALADSATLAHANILLRQLQTLEFHPELCTPTSWTPQNLTHTPMAKYSSDVSAKFRFLSTLLGALKMQDYHIVLTASNRNQSLDMLESFLMGSKLRYDYPGELRSSTSESVDSKLLVTILSTEKAIPVIRYADMIICLDQTHDKDNIKQLRGHHLTDPNHITPIVHAIILNSSQHIERCIRDSVQDSERLKVLLSCIYQLRDKVGNLPDSYPRIPKWNENAAYTVARYLMSSAEGNGIKYIEWTLPKIGSIKDSLGLDGDELSSSSRSSKSKSSSPRDGATSRKRPFNLETLEASKKMRMTPQPHETPNSGDVTRISDSVGGLSQPAGSASIHQPGQIFHEDSVRDFEAMRAELKITQDRLQVSEKQKMEALKTNVELDNRWEKARDQISDLKEQVGHANSRAEVAAREKARMSQALEKKSEELKEMTAKWEAERTKNLESSDPSITENTNLRAELEGKTAAIAKLQKALDGKTMDLEYAQNAFQSGASTAMEQKNKIEALESDVGTLTVRASGERNKAHEMHRQKRDFSKDEEIKRLNGQVRVLEGQINKKDAQYKTLLETKGAGMGTRATSVPRSPRVGGNGGSRAASPLPGSSSRIKALKHG